MAAKRLACVLYMSVRSLRGCQESFTLKHMETAILVRFILDQVSTLMPDSLFSFLALPTVTKTNNDTVIEKLCHMHMRAR